jgi:hypothetical protein
MDRAPLARKPNPGPRNPKPASASESLTRGKEGIGAAASDAMTAARL